MAGKLGLHDQDCGFNTLSYLFDFAYVTPTDQIDYFAVEYTQQYQYVEWNATISIDTHFALLPITILHSNTAGSTKLF